MRRGWRRGFGAALLVAIAAFVTWACLEGGSSHDEPLPAPEGAAASTSVAPPQATIQSEPSPSGFVVQLTAPELVVQSCAIEVTAQISPVDPGAPLVAATLTVSSSGGVVFDGPPTLIDPATGLATWAIERATTEAWSVGAITFLATTQLGNGESIEAALSSEVVAMNVLWIEFEGERYDDGGVINLPCTTQPGTPSQPTNPNGGYLTPTGGTVTCGPVLTYAVILPPNLNALGQPVLSISPSPATSFTITLENFGEAQVQFTSPLVPASPVTLTIVKPAPQEQPRVKVHIEGISFNWDKSGGSDDALNVRMYSRLLPDQDPDRPADARTPDELRQGAYPDDLIHAPLYDVKLAQEKELPAWLPRNEGTKRFHQREMLDDAPANAMFQDSAAVYSAERTDPSKPVTAHVLFRVDVDFLGNPPLRGFGVDITARGTANSKFFSEDGMANPVTFELSPSAVKGHEGHQHSVEGDADRDQAQAKSLRHLRRHYVTFNLRVKSDALSAYRWSNETLAWTYIDPFHPEEGPKKVTYQLPQGGESNETHHRVYVLLADPRSPWRLIPGRDETHHNERPVNLLAEHGRDRLLLDPALPWTHVLDELLAPSATAPPDPDPLAGDGAVGGLAGPRGLDDDTRHHVARLLTLYIQRHDMAGGPGTPVIDIPAPRGFFYNGATPPALEEKQRTWPARRITYQEDGYARYFGGHGARAESPNDPLLRAFSLSREFFVLYSRKPRARFCAENDQEHKATCVCYDLAATNKLLARLLGVELRMRIEQANTSLRAPLQLFGSYDDQTGQRRTWMSGEKRAKVQKHAYNVLGAGPTERVYDPLYLPFVQGAPRSLAGTDPRTGLPLTVELYADLMYQNRKAAREVFTTDKPLIVR